MTRRHLMTLRLLLVLADFVLAAGVFLLVSALRFEADPTVAWSLGFDVGPAAVLFASLWVVVFWVIGIYRVRARWSLIAEARDIARGTLLVLALTLSLLFLFHQEDASRLLLLMLFVVEPATMLATRAALRAWFEGLRRRGRDTSYMLVLGTGPMAQAFADEVEGLPALGLRVIGHLAVDGDRGGETLTRPILARAEELHRIFREHVVDEVAVCLPSEQSSLLDAVVTVAADEGKTVRVPRSAEEGVLATALREEFAGYLVQSVVHDGQRDLERAVKRLIDILGATVALVLLSPVIIGAAIAIRLRDGSPVLFRQARVGRHGRRFTILKFRTMVVGAQERLDELVQHNEVEGPAFKLSDDPRCTRLGRRLRAWSIDELPQLINVLRGDMSLVGPRPALPHEVEEYDIWHRRRLSVRPGITGLWQVEARSDTAFDNWATLDLRYIDQWSLWRDLQILARTVPAVIFSRGR